MVDRQLIGDIALAVLIALPTAAIARPGMLLHKDAVAAVPLIQTTAVAQRAPLTRQSSLLG
jgi:hypothetical protein